MTRLAAMLAVLLAAAPAGAAVRLGSGGAGLEALAAGDDGAYAVVGTGSDSAPYALVTSPDADRAIRLGTFGERESLFPDLAVVPGRVVVTYGREASAAVEYFAHEAPVRRGDRFSPVAALGAGTGPGRLALTPAGVRALAHPDRQGDAVVAGEASFTPLSDDGPQVRHLPLDAVATDAGLLVLDLAQTRTRTVLRVLGPGAPSEAVAIAKGVRDLGGTLVVDTAGIHVAHRGSRGRIVLATSRGGAWSRRTLPGPGGARSAPSVGRAGGRTYVAYDQRTARQQDVYVARSSGTGPPRVTRMTRGGRDELGALVAASAFEVWVGWTARERRRDVAVLDLL